MATPRYRVLERCFIAPWKLEPGSVIETEADPADHLEPLNDEAKAKMEVWYNKTYTYIENGQKVEKQPNLGKRPFELARVEAPTVTLITEPPKENPQAEVLGLDRPLQPDLKPVGESILPEPKTSVDGSTAILSSAPPPKKD